MQVATQSDSSCNSSHFVEANAGLTHRLMVHAYRLPFNGGILVRSGFIVCMTCGFVAPTWSSEGSGGAGSKARPIYSQADEVPIHFNIPAQSLATALSDFGLVTGQSVMFIDSQVAGKTSTALLGPLTAQVALNTLLTGTGLSAQEVSSQHRSAFILVPSVEQPAAQQRTDGLEHDYDALVQARVWQALCANTKTEPGRYRAVLRLQVAQTGHIDTVNLLSSTGNAERDASIRSVLGHLQVGPTPPPEFVQPLTLVILPQDVLRGSGCSSLDRVH
jgi:TonB C terminal